MTSPPNDHTRPGLNAVTAMWLGLAFAALYTLVIWLLGDRLTQFSKLPDQGSLWYYWKLASPTWVTRLSAWGLYAVHQIANFYLIWRAQRDHSKYTDGLHRFNVMALLLNGGFALVHLAQTHIFYDGLAQDVSILSSQGSVIVLLVWVLLMENPRRGLFFGKPVKIGADIIRWAKKYHGYFFSWAIVYTFWYHPAENTSGHLIGFFYMTMLMVQGSLFFTRIHVNRWWTFAQEIMVLAHGTLVAWQQQNNIWPMFFFGFGLIFIITQMHGLGLSRMAKIALTAGFCVLAALVYRTEPLKGLGVIIRIPLIDYLAVLILALLIGGGLWIARRSRRGVAFSTPARP